MTEIKNENNQLSGTHGNDTSNNTRVKITIAIIILLVIILLLFTQCNHGNGEVQQGIIDLPESITQRLVDEAVDTSMFQVFINTKINVDEHGNANVMIQNTEKNHYPCFVEIVNHNEEQIYKSDIIKLGYKIEQAKLNTDKSKSPGDYNCTAYFNVLDQSERKTINKIGINIVVTY